MREKQQGFELQHVIGDMIWITGGYDGNKTFASTEQIYLNKTIRTGPTLPKPINDHCMASDENTIFFVGGTIDWSKGSKEVLTYNKSNIFEGHATISPMIYGRKGHGCTVFYSKHYGRNVLLVAGGTGSNGASTSAEILDFLNPKFGFSTAWKESK